MSRLKTKYQFRRKVGGKFRGFRGFPGNSGTACTGMVRNDGRKSLVVVLRGTTKGAERASKARSKHSTHSAHPPTSTLCVECWQGPASPLMVQIVEKSRKQFVSEGWGKISGKKSKRRRLWPEEGSTPFLRS
jgi:hypothetical protein